MERTLSLIVFTFSDLLLKETCWGVAVRLAAINKFGLDLLVACSLSRISLPSFLLSTGYGDVTDIAGEGVRFDVGGGNFSLSEAI